MAKESDRKVLRSRELTRLRAIKAAQEAGDRLDDAYADADGVFASDELVKAINAVHAAIAYMRGSR
jgi:hypothetical protein